MSNYEVVRPHKGGVAEECLREYFRSLGSFVLRGVPVREGDVTVTDIDLWAYTKVSVHSRHIAIVDVKNRRKGRAFERAIWVRGLQSTLGADEAIVASQGVRESARAFFDRVGIRVMSSSVFDAIVQRYSGQEKRLTGEQIDSMWKDVMIDTDTVKMRIHRAKSEISNGIDFRALNTWLDDAVEFLALAVEREREAGAFTRAAYFCCALAAMGADYLGKDHSLSDTAIRNEFFRHGMLLGGADVDMAGKYLDFAESAVRDFLDPSGAASAQIRTGLEREIERLPIRGLAEFFSRPTSSSELLKGAIALEEACHAKKGVTPRDLDSVEGKSVIGLIGDYGGLARKDLLGVRDDGRGNGDARERQEGQGELIV